MPDSKIFSSDPFKTIQYQAKMQKGKLSEKDLKNHGKKITATNEKIKIFFEGLSLRLFYGKQASKKYKKEFFINKSQQLVNEINKKKLYKKIPGITDRSLSKYLSMIRNGEVLISNSHYWEKIKKVNTLEIFLSETKGSLKQHWLQAFATNEDLGENLEQLNPFQLMPKNQGFDENVLDKIYEIHQLYRVYLIPEFVSLLQKILEPNSRLKNISKEQIKEFDSCLYLYRELKKLDVSDPLGKAQKIFLFYKIIERKNGVDSAKHFEKHLLKNPALLELLTNIPFLTNNHLFDIQGKLNQLTSFPEEISFCESVEEIVEILHDHINFSDSSVIEKKFGKSLEKIFSTAEHKEIIQELGLIEKNFRVCGKSNFFLQLMNESFNKITTDKEFKESFYKLKKEHASTLSLINQVSNHSKIYLNYGIPAHQVRNFQNDVLNSIMNKHGVDWIVAKVKGKEGVEKDLSNKVMEFNLSQLNSVKDRWRDQFGNSVTEQLLIALGPNVLSGKHYYKTNLFQLPNFNEISEIFVRFNAQELEEQFGKDFMGHAMYFLLNFHGKEAQKKSPHFETVDWSHFIKKLTQKKNDFINNGFSEIEFQKELNDFLSDYTKSKNNSFILDDQFFSLFLIKLNQVHLGKVLLESEKKYGTSYKNALVSYLKENEPDVLVGNSSIIESWIFKADSLEEQVHFFLMPYLMSELRPYEIIDNEKVLFMDKSFVSSILLKEPLSDEKLQIRFNNLLELKKAVFKELKDKKRIFLARALIKELSSAYLFDFDLQKDHGKRIQKNRDAVKHIIKFENEINSKGIYSLDLFSRAVKHFIDSASGNTPEEKLMNFTKKTSGLFHSNLNEEFHSICFNLFLQDLAHKACHKLNRPCDSQIIQLIQSLQLRFKHQEMGIKTALGAKYLEELVEFAVSLSLHNPDKSYITLDAISKESKYIHLDLKKINKTQKTIQLIIPEDIKQKITDIVQDHSIENTEKIIKTLQNNPFGIIQEFIPRLLEKLLQENDYKQINKFRKHLAKIAPLFHQSTFASTGVKLISRGLQTLVDLQKLDLHEGLNPGKIKELIAETIENFNSFPISLELNRVECKDLLEQNNFDVFDIVANKALKAILDGHQVIHKKSVINGSKDFSTIIFQEVLPAFVKYRGKIEKAIDGLEFLIPLVRKVGGGWIASKVLKKLLASQLDEINQLDGPTKKLLLEGIEAFITTTLLAAPELLKRHNFETYFNFLEDLNTKVQQSKPLNKDEIYINLLKIIQQGTKELGAYGSLLEEVADSTFASLG